jgi:hypothetical protein
VAFSAESFANKHQDVQNRRRNLVGIANCSCSAGYLGSMYNMPPDTYEDNANYS